VSGGMLVGALGQRAAGKVCSGGGLTWTLAGLLPILRFGHQRAGALPAPE